MENIVFLMCGKDKEKFKTRAKYLYKSKRFQKSLQYAKILANENYIFILSAKHGLLELEIEIEPYDKSIYDMSITEKDEWAKMVISKLKTKVDIDNNNFIFLTDDFYSEYLCKHLSHFELPLNGLNQNEHLSWFFKILNEKGE
jgi:hypothetical protein